MDGGRYEIVNHPRNFDGGIVRAVPHLAAHARGEVAMAYTEAQKRASAKYVKNNVKRREVAFYPDDRELLEWLDSQPNKAGYIKRLIREDMERSR